MWWYYMLMLCVTPAPRSCTQGIRRVVCLLMVIEGMILQVVDVRDFRRCGKMSGDISKVIPPCLVDLVPANLAVFLKFFAFSSSSLVPWCSCWWRLGSALESDGQGYRLVGLLDRCLI
ncbi:hypothetical protein BDP81DRAFT_123385 [Colletotrichum phormii]|uniref:Secreted protein n=1 Tax=Colletotrichum phormii TaxID=359342 RepID=A0AAJ0EIW6_9PEZI|nr:uncharacterized protein BDP81DRAFT_123385 [Colletotrichum phormii]KAK1640823.1 hypothetical protein BDP81DRAFT_123385 [Colletotrichum phormii]